MHGMHSKISTTITIIGNTVWANHIPQPPSRFIIQVSHWSFAGSGSCTAFLMCSITSVMLSLWSGILKQQDTPSILQTPPFSAVSKSKTKRFWITASLKCLISSFIIDKAFSVAFAIANTVHANPFTLFIVTVVPTPRKSDHPTFAPGVVHGSDNVYPE